MLNYHAIADEEFSQARAKESISRILGILRTEQGRLLSLHEVTSVLKPASQSYVGMRVIPVSSIVGSEGRYHDFNRRFLPKHKHLRTRWTRVDVAHHRNVVLPPIKLYDIGGVYFVRDGNHRVSVANSQGVEFIDAEITSLNTQLSLKPNMTPEDLKQAVIDYEKRSFHERIPVLQYRPDADITFTATGRYDDISLHINCHKYYLNQNRSDEIPFDQAMLSWYDTVYRSIVEIVREERLLSVFRGRTESDLYVWVVRHWDELKRKLMLPDSPVEM